MSAASRHTRRVLVVSPVGKAHLGDHFMDGFRDAGHEVTAWDYRRATYHGKTGFSTALYRAVLATFPHWVRRAGRLLAEEIDRVDPDFTLVVKGELFAPEAIRRLVRDEGRAVYVYHPDAPWPPKGNALVNRALKEYSGAIAYDSGHLPYYRRLGVDACTTVPFAANPRIHFPIDLTAEERKTWGSAVAFVGNRRPPGSLLDRVLSALARDGVDLKVWGPAWSRSEHPAFAHALTGRGVFGLDMTRVHAASGVVVNATDSQSLSGANMRLFEAAGAGACVLTDDLADVHRFFTPGEDVVVYDSPEDAVERARELLADPGKAAAIGARAAERVRREHTYAHRADAIVDFHERTTR